MFLYHEQVHVQQIADDLGCILIQKEGLPGMMYVERGYIEGPVIQNQIDYFLVSHELGLFALGHPEAHPPNKDKGGFLDRGFLRTGARGWEWALDHTKLDPVGNAARLFMWDTCLSSYYVGYLAANGHPSRLWNGDRYYVQFVYDAPDAYFDRVVRRIKGKTKGFKHPYPDTTPKLPSIGQRLSEVLAAEDGDNAGAGVSSEYVHSRSPKMSLL